MRVHLIASAVVVAALAQGAYAQNSKSANTMNQNSAQAGQQSAQSLPAEIKNKLTSEGFTDVTVVPGSFVVQAKDKQGDPVMMLIGPHSMTIITATGGNNQQSTTGSSTSGGNNAGTSPSNSKK